MEKEIVRGAKKELIREVGDMGVSKFGFGSNLHTIELQTDKSKVRLCASSSSSSSGAATIGKK